MFATFHTCAENISSTTKKTVSGLHEMESAPAVSSPGLDYHVSRFSGFPIDADNPIR
jgi:hypothetical protein